ncbi:MAG: transposase [Thiotrichales bacterium]|nr:transposase [Thiotrichales bacterium]
MNTLSIAQNLLVAKQPRKRYSTEFKRQILKACYQPNTSIAQVAREHGLNANLIHNWKRALKTS